MKTENLLLAIIAMAFAVPTHAREMPEDMPREDVIDIPAIGEGLCLSQIFQSNMVIQRDKPISIWGWAEPGEDVTVSFSGTTGSASAGRDRAWKITLDALPANAAPQSMTIKGKTKTLALDNILLGDVWILSGQSNMEFPLAKVENGNLEIAAANYPEIRMGLGLPAERLPRRPMPLPGRPGALFGQPRWRFAENPPPHARRNQRSQPAGRHRHRRPGNHDAHRTV